MFHCNFNDKIISKNKSINKSSIINYPVVIDIIRHELQKIFPQVNKDLVNLFQFLLHVLTHSTEGNALPSEEIYVILYNLSLFQNKRFLSSSKNTQRRVPKAINCLDQITF